MDVDEDDDFYAPEEATPTATEPASAEPAPQPAVKPEQDDEDLEEGEEEDEAESDDSIITERKDGTKAAPPQPRYNEIRNIPQRTTTSDVAAKLPPVKKEKGAATKAAGTPPVSGADLPGLAISKIDVDAKPIYEPAGKPITQVNIDEDLNENDKPWRRPGTDISDYFNYGFDEFTWALYASKQESLRSEFDANKIAQNNKKMFEDMNMMMAMGMPGGMGGIPGMEGMTPEMMQQMQQMMASGMDPSQMDPSMFGGAAAGGAGFGQGGNQQAGYGFDQNMMAGGGGGGETRNRGGNFGRGRGGRRNW
ncbi:hypothetical protein CJF30_00001058 [Rutstroemia sp. NJR-2017a BBW]|nr:hypothetical protein CJF30_00001058 [Rutstroemia sp. NJR-2017a BBW]